VPVTWNYTASPAPPGANGCTTTPTNDPDIPDGNPPQGGFPAGFPTYTTTYKVFYTMDGMDIGPMLDQNGDAVKDSNNNTVYELHYTPDWTHKLGATCDLTTGTNPTPIIRQLKYQNPPADSTVITYVTQHTATSGSPSVIVLLLSGTARKVNYKEAYYNPTIPTTATLPLGYVP
jgi:hypothetical protein